MESISLTSLADEKLAEARQAHSGRAAHTLHGGHTHELRQTLMALLAGQGLAEHDSPGQASLQVLQGHVQLTAGDDEWDGKAGDYVVIPPQRHSLHAGLLSTSHCGRRPVTCWRVDHAGSRPRGSRPRTGIMIGSPPSGQRLSIGLPRPVNAVRRAGSTRAPPRQPPSAGPPARR